MIPPTLNEPSALMLPVPPAPLKMGLELGSKTFRLALLMAAVPKLTEKPAFQSFPSSAFQEVLPPVANVPLMSLTLRPRPPGPARGAAGTFSASRGSLSAGPAGLLPPLALKSRGAVGAVARPTGVFARAACRAEAISAGVAGRCRVCPDEISRA